MNQASLWLLVGRRRWWASPRPGSCSKCAARGHRSRCATSSHDPAPPRRRRGSPGPHAHPRRRSDASSAREIAAVRAAEIEVALRNRHRELLLTQALRASPSRPMSTPIADTAHADALVTDVTPETTSAEATCTDDSSTNDGSTDDTSTETRRWKTRRWKSGGPFRWPSTSATSRATLETPLRSKARRDPSRPGSPRRSRHRRGSRDATRAQCRNSR